jgi:serine/threonine-protein kinase
MTIQIGSSIGGYRAVGFLGEGGMAQVYRVRNEGLGRDEALKLLPSQYHDQRQVVRRFTSEARTAARLHHPNIAAIHGVSDGGPPYYFVMELVEGPTLAQWIAQRGPLPLQVVLPIVEQIAKALDYAHARGVIHRDVKPGNVLLSPDGATWCVKVVDFGIARAGEDDSGTRYTQTGTFVGTPEYMSPEQSGSGHPVDKRSDIYSLGVIVYEMLCGRPPFPAAPSTPPVAVMMRHVQEAPRAPCEACPSLSPNTNAAILRALAKAPALRFSSCSEFVCALRGEVAVSLPPKGEHSNIEGDRMNNSMAALAAALFFCGGLLLIGGGLYQERSSTFTLPVPSISNTIDQPSDVDLPNPTPTPVPTPVYFPNSGNYSVPALAGTRWAGTWGHYANSKLTIDVYDGRNFSGLLFAGDDFQVPISGTIDPQSGQIAIYEGTALPSKNNLTTANWGQSSNSTGTFSNGWNQLNGSGTVAGGNAFGWEFTRSGGY